MHASTRTALLAGGLVLAVLPASAETTLCKKITSLPYTITAQGAYCLDRNLATGIATGNAITIDTDFVVLDLNGFKIGGGGAGAATQAVGVYSSGHKNVTVRNGNIRGFRVAVHLPGASGSGHVVEGLRADGNTMMAISVDGTGAVIRDNAIVGTGGTTAIANADSVGIQALGPGARVMNNDVTETIGTGIGAAYGILLLDAAGAVVENNRVGNATVASGSFGIDASGGDDILIVANRVTGFDTGVAYTNGATGKYRDNLTSGVNTAFTGGTDAGGNN